MYPVLITVNYLIYKNFDSGSIFLNSVNNLLSGRITLGKQALQLYGIKPLGQNIYIRGNGGIQGLNNVTDAYFFIDSSFLDILIRYGAFFLLLLLLFI